MIMITFISSLTLNGTLYHYPINEMGVQCCSFDES